MIVLAQAVNEERYIDRVLGHIINEPFCTRFILIDGGSTDYTREAVLEYPKTEVFIHPWVDWYHDMNVMQRNVGLSYVPHGKLAVIIDFDERFSQPLIDRLNEIEETGLESGIDALCFPRKTFHLLRHEDDSPFAVLDDDGWPIPSGPKGEYPDYQMRLIRRKVGMHFVNSPHHVVFGFREGLFKEDFLPEGMDILHYDGKDDSRDRNSIERKWARAQARRKELGLTHDVFECRLAPEHYDYGQPGTWKTNPKGR